MMLTVLSGNFALYVTLDGSVPSFLNYDYSSTLFSPEINILSSDAVYAPCLASECDIRIAVFGMTTCSYSLSITSNTASTVLRMNIPIQASVPANMYDYFKVVLSNPTRGMRVSLTEFSGSAILYASCHTQFPNSSTHTHEWYYMAADRNSGPYLDITSLDLMDNNCPVSGGYLFLAVRGFTSTTYR